ncbi:hypothetical protein pb186bvf_019926 [Paramecium bursaria]
MYDCAINLKSDDPQYYNNKGIADYIEANSLHNLSQYSNAIKMYDKAIQLCPNNAQYYFKKGNSLCNFGQYDLAITMYDKAINNKPQTYQFYLNKGTVYLFYIANALYIQEKYFEVLEQLDQAIKQNSNIDSVYLLKGYFLAKYQQILQNYQVNMKKQYQLMNKPHKLIHMMINIISIKVQNIPKIIMNQGLCYQAQSNYNQSIQNYEQAIQLNPNQTQYILHKAICLQYLNQFEEAKITYDYAIQINATDPRLYFNKSNLLNQMNEYNESLEVINLAIKLNPNDARYYNNKANIFQILKQYDDAILSYDIAISLNPNDVDYYYNKGICFLKQNAYESSITIFQKALQLNNKDPQIYYSLCIIYVSKGDAHMKQKRYDQALDMIKNALNLNDSNIEFIFRKGEKIFILAILLKQVKQYEESIRLLKLVVKFDQPNSNIAKNLISFNKFISQKEQRKNFHKNDIHLSLINILIYFKNLNQVYNSLKNRLLKNNQCLNEFSYMIIQKQCDEKIQSKIQQMTFNFFQQTKINQESSFLSIYAIQRYEKNFLIFCQTFFIVCQIYNIQITFQCPITKILTYLQKFSIKMQNKQEKVDNRICVRCKTLPGVVQYSYHCNNCHLVIQGNQGNPFFQLDAEQQQNTVDFAETEEIRKQKQKEKEDKKRKFWDYEFEDKYDRGSHQMMRMLRNWNGGKVLSPLRQARLLIREVLLEEGKQSPQEQQQKDLIQSLWLHINLQFI